MKIALTFPFMMLVFFGLSVPIMNAQVLKGGKKNPDYMGQFYIMGGARTLKMKQTSSSFFYKDESANSDSISVNKEFKKDELAVDVLCMGGDFNIYKNISIYGQVDFYYQRAVGANFNLGVCYNIYTKYMELKPNIALNIGGIGYGLGTMVNKDEYITVNGKEFVGKDVKIDLNNNHFDIKPGVAFQIPISKLLALRGDFGFNLNLSTWDRISFGGVDVNGESLTTNKKLSDNSVSFRNSVTDQRILSVPSFRNGVFVHLGIAFNLHANHNVSTSTSPNSTKEKEEEKPTKTYTPPKVRNSPPPREVPKAKPGY